MKKNSLTIFIYVLLLVGGIITFFIIFKDVDSSFSFVFISGYMIFLVLSVFYFIIAIIINMKKLKWREIRNRLLKFIAYFIFLCTISYLVGYMYKPLQSDLSTIVINSISLSFAFVFVDLVFFKEKRS